MDVSKLIWLLVIVVVVGGAWLFTSGGVNYQFNKYTETPVSEESAESQVAHEKGLSKLGGFLLSTFRYERAAEVYKTAIERYPTGENVWWNAYQLARAYEKMENYEEAVRWLVHLRDSDADAQDERVPGRDALGLRIQNLVEVHEIPGYT